MKRLIGTGNIILLQHWQRGNTLAAIVKRKATRRSIAKAIKNLTDVLVLVLLAKNLGCTEGSKKDIRRKHVTVEIVERKYIEELPAATPGAVTVVVKILQLIRRRHG